MTQIPIACHVCGQAVPKPLAAYAVMPRVSSDCRLFPSGGMLAVCPACGTAQKPATSDFLREIGGIYAIYDVYHQGDGAEQVVMDSEAGGLMRRSELLTARIAASGLLPAEGRAIDVGCGNGSLLRALGPHVPNWDLYGLELDDRNLAGMLDIPRFRGLLQGDATTLTGQYTLLTMVHALEHFTDPYAALVSLRANVAENGLVFIEVPNLQENPFDLLIADHATHFTPASLEAILLRAGFEIVRLETGWVKKEISVLARPARGPTTAVQPALPKDLAATHLDWLDATLAAARAAAAAAPVFGVFGTSIAATWLVGSMGERIAFHVDEDKNRQGRDFFGKPVLAPDAVPPGAVVFLALASPLAEAIAGRLARFGLQAVKPPPMKA
jgi:SAM-dependent methyltransferase